MPCWKQAIPPPLSPPPSIGGAYNLFEMGALIGDARRANPCPGSVPPRRAMHLVFQVGAPCLAFPITPFITPPINFKLLQNHDLIFHNFAWDDCSMPNHS